MQQVRAGLPARRHPRQGLRARRTSTARRPASSPTDYKAARVRRAGSTRSRSRPRTAPAATSASRSARPRTRPNPRHKAINMAPQPPLLRGARRATSTSSSTLPEPDRATGRHLDVKSSQFLEPLFEFSGACAGCGETPYLKLLTQLFGDRLLIANATGCSSIYGGNLPTTPYTAERATAAGRPGRTRSSRTTPSSAWACASRVDSPSRAGARARSSSSARAVGDDLVDGDPRRGPGDRGRASRAQRERVAALRQKLARDRTPDGAAARRARRLPGQEDRLDRRRRRLGLRHRLRRPRPRPVACGRNVNVLVLDTEVYSNTGGQASKATPLGAVAKFAAAGKARPQEGPRPDGDGYGNVYVARVAFGAKDAQTVKAFLEAESYRGPVADHRLQPLHRPRLRPGATASSSRSSRSTPALAALPLRPAADRRRRAAARARLAAAAGRHRRLHAQRGPLPHGRADQDPERFRHLLDERAAARAQRIALYEQLAQIALTLAPAERRARGSRCHGRGGER